MGCKLAESRLSIIGRQSILNIFDITFSLANGNWSTAIGNQLSLKWPSRYGAWKHPAYTYLYHETVLLVELTDTVDHLLVFLHDGGLLS